MAANGVNAVTGSYLLPPTSVAEVARAARGQRLDANDVKELRARHHQVSEARFGLGEGIDPKTLAEAGWGVIFASDADPEVRGALAPLLVHRRGQAAARVEHRYREFAGDKAYRPGESKHAFLARQGVGPGSVDPDRVPYYLLIVADPSSIPYGFQYQLDVQYAVGRIHFDDVRDYARYAESVVAAETQPVHRSRSTLLFGTRHPGDPPTSLSADELIVPLAAHLDAMAAGPAVRTVVGEHATKARLVDALASERPALLFTASHGVGFPRGHRLQQRHQGALLCQDWPGPEGPAKPIVPDQYLSADDLDGALDLHGLLSFHFACFGAGTPQWDDFAQAEENRPELAPAPFVAGLPKALLAQDSGGALAAVGHVERAWGWSFLWPDAGRQVETFRSTLVRLIDGHPVGSALEHVNERYAELASDLSTMLEDMHYGKRPDEEALAAIWTASNDARGFAIIGDPAVRLADGAKDGSRDTRRTLRVSEPTGSNAPSQSDVDFGLFDGLRDVRQRLVDAVRAVGENLAAVIEAAVAETTVVEVATYVSDDVDHVIYDRSSGRFQGAELRYLSRATIGGDSAHVMRADEAADSEPLWTLHSRSLMEARTARLELLKAAAAAAAGLLDTTRGL